LGSPAELETGQWARRQHSGKELQRKPTLSRQGGYVTTGPAVSKGIEARRTEMARHSTFCPVADLFFEGERFCSNQTQGFRACAALDRSGGALRGGGSAARLSRVQNRARTFNLR